MSSNEILAAIAGLVSVITTLLATAITIYNAKTARREKEREQERLFTELKFKNRIDSGNLTLQALTIIQEELSECIKARRAAERQLSNIKIEITTAMMRILQCSEGLRVSINSGDIAVVKAHISDIDEIIQEARDKINTLNGENRV